MYLKETDSRETWLSGDSGTVWTYLCEEKRERRDKEFEIPEGSSGQGDKGHGHKSARLTLQKTGSSQRARASLSLNQKFLNGCTKTDVSHIRTIKKASTQTPETSRASQIPDHNTAGFKHLSHGIKEPPRSSMTVLWNSVIVQCLS
ncbi:hypothetical protein IRJ41_025779 [Triplophysa rosa]|uniref:Uncharacterized protein n=1 Tax=Triplophysa rosa TaxID=992332 RepID=A0A9W7WK48_TRIRA|nr:hypothetical protein IRJ41_025779 [Triplophysa rosa]